MKMSVTLPLCLMAMLLASPPLSHAAPDPEEKKPDKTLDKAGDIAAQPVRDVGIDKKKIPPVLQDAVVSPYAPPARNRCAAIANEMAALNEVLGPDFGTGQAENEDKFGKLAEAGGSALVNSLIPFRGLVREVSGAAAADRRYAAAISAGMARRGYLRGLGVARRCRMP